MNFSKIIEFILSNILAPLFVVVSSSIILPVYSKYTTGDWIEWIIANSTYLLAITIFIIIIWGLSAFVYNRIKEVRRINAGPPFAVIRNPINGWKYLGPTEYNNVIWDVQIPNPSLFEVQTMFDTLDDINVKTPPKCPICGTELEESLSYLVYYKWKCVACDFKKRNRDSWYTEKDRVKKITKNDLKKQMEN